MFGRFNKLFMGASLLLLAVVFLVPAHVHAATTTEQPDIVNNLCAGANLQIGTTCANGGSGAAVAINHLIHLIINILSLIVGVVAVVMIMIGGFRYITSGGSDTGVTGAKNTILYAIIGLIIVAMAQLIVRFVLGRLLT